MGKLKALYGRVKRFLCDSEYDPCTHSGMNYYLAGAIETEGNTGNTVIHLAFADGSKRQYKLNDEGEHRILAGEPFSVETIHPEFGEVCLIKIGVEITAESLKEEI